MKKFLPSLAFLIPLLVFPPSVQAHFGMIIPSLPTVTTTKEADISLTLRFWHPFANQGMNLDKPAVFTVSANGAVTDLLPAL
jgi:cobalt/nickel transport protein